MSVLGSANLALLKPLLADTGGSVPGQAIATEPGWFDAACGAGRGWGRMAAAEACVFHRGAGNFRSPSSHAKRVSRGMMAHRTTPPRQLRQSPLGRAARPSPKGGSAKAREPR
jgi:hypothetical protein